MFIVAVFDNANSINPVYFGPFLDRGIAVDYYTKAPDFFKKLENYAEYPAGYSVQIITTIRPDKIYSPRPYGE